MASVCGFNRQMGIKWRNSRSQSIRLGQSCVSSIQQESKQLGWQILWRKFKKEKEKIFSCSSVELRSSYNPNAYQLNFDEENWGSDPDNLCRSFSARFADPSIVSRNLRLLD
ncbi:unnamed protein product [Citrullus colocynthis]|uniref:Uncharacterized protein n=1 Tax=Citrullus colocynthis TaxID=252529 RepID=A0ABP0YYY5_9ROSI